MKKTLWIVLLIAITFYSYAQDATDYASFYITGYDVNLRTTPNLESKVYEQANWGDRYLAKRYNKNWLQAYAWDDSQILYIHADYISNFEGFINKALKLNDRNPKTELLILEHYIENQEYDSAVYLAIKLINKSPDETIFTGFEHCELISHSAFQKVQKPKINQEKRSYINSRLKEKIENTIILNLIELSEIEDLIKNGYYAEADKRLNRILEIHSDNLQIQIACDYDAGSKFYPQIWFKNLYFINYHLMSDEGKGKVNNYLRNAITNWENGKQKEIAIDIQQKLSGIWQIN